MKKKQQQLLLLRTDFLEQPLRLNQKNQFQQQTTIKKTSRQELLLWLGLTLLLLAGCS